MPKSTTDMCTKNTIQIQTQVACPESSHSTNVTIPNIVNVQL